MTLQGSIDRDLEAFAHSAANLLNVPFVTIALYGDDRKALFVDQSWADEHPEVDAEALDNPAAAVVKNLPFFAALPIRDTSGVTVGLLSCGGSDERDLSEQDLGVLKDVTAQIAARVGGLEKMPVAARA